jgi:hypothetical protein
MKPGTKTRGSRGRSRRRRAAVAETPTSEVSALARDVERHTGTGPRLTGGDVDAAWDEASAVGDEAVGGSTLTPDQDVVDELGAALGVPQDADAEVRTAGEILEERDRHRWRTEREIALDAREAEEP